MNIKIPVSDFKAEKEIILENEKKINLLLEKKGVALYNFRKEIENIYSYILEESEKKIKFLELKPLTIAGKYSVNGNGFTFKIPTTLLKTLDFVKNLEIQTVVMVYNNVPENAIENAKRTAISFVKPINNVVTRFKHKLKFGNIVVSFSIINGAPDKETLLKSLYHELGHLYQDYNIIRNTKNKNSLTNKTTNLNSLSYFRNSDDEALRAIYWIIYILFSNEELSQFASSVYSEMKAGQINFNETESYKTYEGLKRDIEWLNGINISDFWADVATHWVYKDKNYSTNVFGLKEYIISTAIKRLNVYYSKMLMALELFEEEND